MSHPATLSSDMDRPDADGAEAPLRVAVCGEVCSGKSALVNGLMRQVQMPDFFGQPKRPVIEIKPSAEAGWTGIFEDGSTRSLDPSEPVPLDDGVVKLEIGLGDAGAHLQGIEIVELPPLCHEGVSDAEIDRIAECDVLIWATIGSQAWRLSEKTILDYLGSDRPRRAALAITRADKFRNDDDRQRVFERVKKGSAAYFDTVILTSASERQIGKATNDDAAWDASGMAELCAWVHAQVGQQDDTPEPEPKDAAGDVVALDDYRAAHETAEGDDPASGAADDLAEPVETPAVATELDAAQEDSEAAEDPAPEQDEAAPISAVAVIAPPPSAASQSAPPASAAPAFSTSRGITLAGTFKAGAPERVSLIVGEAEAATTYAELADALAQQVLTSPVFEGTETADVSLPNQHLVFGPAGQDDMILVMVCDPYTVPRGAARARFLKYREGTA